MGMSASQARLLNLTSRMHDIEYKAQNLEAQKLQMANESTQVYKEYEDVLNKTKIQQKQINNDGSAYFVDATYQSLKDAGYLFTFVNKGESKYVATSKEDEAFQDIQTRGLSALDFAAKITGKDKIDGYTAVYTVEAFLEACKSTTSSSSEIILMNDLDFSGVGLVSNTNNVKYYLYNIQNKTIDGNGHKIYGLQGALANIAEDTVNIENLAIEVDIVCETPEDIEGVWQSALINTNRGTTTLNNVIITGSVVDNSTNDGNNGNKRRISPVIANNGGTLTVNNTTIDVDITAPVIVNQLTDKNNSVTKGVSLSNSTNATTNIDNVIFTGTYIRNTNGEDFSSKYAEVCGGSTGATLTTNKQNLLTQSEIAKYTEIFNRMKAGYVIDTEQFDSAHLNTSKWLTNMINNGDILLSKLETGTLSYIDVNVATDTNLQEISDEVELKKAEAKYEADMRKINAKDKKFDTDLASMDQERNAIKTEMDTLKSVAKDNVDRAFKLFS